MRMFVGRFWLLILCTILIHSSRSLAQSTPDSSNGSKRVNIFVFSREKRSTMAGFSIRTNAWFAKLFHNRLHTVNISSPEELPERIREIMERKAGQMIGNLWIDSHGSYRAGRSLFLLGYDTVDHRRVDSPGIREALSSIARYCDGKSYVSIGSCYGSAEYIRPANQYLSAQPMNGDSLMLAIAQIFPQTPVLGAESWVMTKPFLFGNKWGLNGYPLAHHFKDTIFRPVWERLGEWQMVTPGSSSLVKVHSVSLTGSGDIRFNEINYLDREGARRRQRKHMANLEPDLYGNTHPK